MAEPTIDTGCALACAEPDRAAEATAHSPAAEPLVEDELLVEDVSIDGMCGVY